MPISWSVFPGVYALHSSGTLRAIHYIGTSVDYDDGYKKYRHVHMALADYTNDPLTP
jgi:hypothetical protein